MKSVIRRSLNLNLYLFSIFSLVDFAVMYTSAFFIHLFVLFSVLQLLYAETKLVLFVVNLAFVYVGHTEVIKGVFS
jgi:hypothetical protein